MMAKHFHKLGVLILLALTQALFAQESKNSFPKESLLKFSPSKRIALVSNKNASFGLGDFISLIYNNKLISRAIVAKMTGEQEQVGAIRIIKVYEVELWSKIESPAEIEVLRGDDSVFAQKKETPLRARILDEEQLFDQTTFLEGDAPELTDDFRLIKTSNMLGAGWGFVEVASAQGGSDRVQHLGIRFARQLADNIWGEIHAGQATIQDYPLVDDVGLVTSLISINTRLGYLLQMPFDSYIRPYIGMQWNRATSTDAGNADTPSASEEELAQVEQLNQSSLIFGASLFKRVVPGWFMTADIGNDFMGVGLALEF